MVRFTYSSWCCTTVALLTTNKTLASPPPFSPPPSSASLSLFLLCWIEGSIAPSKRGGRAVYKTKTTTEMDATRLSAFSVPFPSVTLSKNITCTSSLLPLGFYSYTCVCVCKLSKLHKELQWHQTGSHRVLCLRSPRRWSPPLQIWTELLLNDHNNGNVHQTTKKKICEHKSHKESISLCPGGTNNVKQF